MIPATADALLQTDLPLGGRRQGKVRDIYDATLADGMDALVIIATDRISGFDVVMPNGIPGKGIVLTQISKFWFDMIADKLGHTLQHHLISTEPDNIPGLSESQRQSMRGRVMIGRKTKVVPIECVVRGYLAGSAWSEYQRSGTVCGIGLPTGLKQCQKLPEPLFTPATKAESGHDENISFEQACQVAGQSLMSKMRDLSLSIYRMGHDYALGRGIILADTKFEFGVDTSSCCLHNNPISDREDDDVTPVLIDEVLTPDSSRFWPCDKYEPGRDQPSFDKQYVRNYLQQLVDNGRWNKTPPGPVLPEEVVRHTLTKYVDAYRVLTDREISL